MNKQRVLKLMVSILGTYEIKEADLLDWTKITGISQNSLSELFPGGRYEILLDVLEYAGRLWLDKLKVEIESAEKKEEKLKILLSGYALGTENYAAFLSLYIDLWKCAKDDIDGFVKLRLNNIYEMYICRFQFFLREIGISFWDKEEAEAMGIIMTGLSDALHIQSFLMNNKSGMEKVKSVVEKLAVFILQT